MRRGLPKLLVIVRHAESDRNAAKKGETFYADEASRDAAPDYPDHQTPLTAKGRRHARRIGKLIFRKYGKPDVVRHSGFVRTRKTWHGMSLGLKPKRRKKVDVRRDHRLRERGTGWCARMTKDEVERFFPWLKRYWKEAGVFEAKPPGGESLGDVANRLEPLVRGLRNGKAGRIEYWYTHGNTTRAARFLIEKLPYEALDEMRWPHNCGIVVYRLKRGKLRLVVANELLCEP